MENQLIDLIIPWEPLLMEITECWGPAGCCTLTLLGWGRRGCGAPLKPLLPPHPKWLMSSFPYFHGTDFPAWKSNLVRAVKFYSSTLKSLCRSNVGTCAVHAFVEWMGTAPRPKHPLGFGHVKTAPSPFAATGQCPWGHCVQRTCFKPNTTSPGACSSTASSTHTRQHHFNQ